MTFCKKFIAIGGIGRLGYTEFEENGTSVGFSGLSEDGECGTADAALCDHPLCERSII